MKDKDMKALFLLPALLMMFITPAFAQTPISNQGVQVYTQGCMRQPSVTMDQATLAQFCQCTGLAMQQNLTMEDVRAQAGNDQAARNALNKVVTQVYAPCMQYPIRALVFRQCGQNPETAGRPGVCECAANNMAAYTQREAQTQLPKLFASNPNITDPSTALMSTPEFEAAQKQIAEACSKQAAPAAR